ncbi:MAG TPA: hypothetical protein VKB69_13725, partial [Micromonosporaceae bacterium]|nr:hypothetical protein [Micromonosporaceae bacterium]
MSHGGEMFVGDAAVSNLGFATSLRGFDKREVAAYVQHAEMEIAALTAERDEAIRQAQALAMEAEHLRSALDQIQRARMHPPAATFADLGPRVEHIIALAEEQAASIIKGAESSIVALRAEAERLLAEAQAERSSATRDLETVLATRRRDEDKAATARREAAQAEFNAAQQYVAKVRAEIDAQSNAAQEHARRTVGDAMAQAERTLAEATAAAAARRTETDAHVAHQRSVFEAEFAALRNEAERYAVTTRAQAEEAARKVSESVRVEAEAMISSARAQ